MPKIGRNSGEICRKMAEIARSSPKYGTENGLLPTSASMPCCGPCREGQHSSTENGTARSYSSITKVALP